MNSVAFVGEAACECLKQDQSGVVDCVFERSAYLDFTDTYLCIALSEIGRGPLNIVYDSDTESLPPAFIKDVPITFSADDQTLRINDQVVAVMHHASVCHNTIKITDPDLSVLADQQRSMVFMRAPKSGLMPIVAALIDNTHHRSGAIGENVEVLDKDSIDCAFKRFATPLLQDLMMWIDQTMCGDHLKPGSAEGISKLLGAGPGLTPSGDDLLAGVLLTLRVCNQENAAQDLWKQLEPEILQRTNRVSAALLAEAAEGRAGEYALAAIRMYISTNDLDESDLSGVLACIGETSGWDMFAGVLLVLNAKVNISFSNPVRVCKQELTIECLS
ncbi:MAG: DUF2877 domain-containing protein [Granulosicoccus sp.]